MTSKELFNIHSNTKKYNTKFKYSSAIKDINKLEIGDYVVHNVHGIGVYNGIVTLSSNNNLKDYLEILYAGTDKIYIPVEKISLFLLYVSIIALPRIIIIRSTFCAALSKSVSSR